MFQFYKFVLNKYNNNKKKTFNDFGSAPKYFLFIFIKNILQAVYFNTIDINNMAVVILLKQPHLYLISVCTGEQ